MRSPRSLLLAVALAALAAGCARRPAPGRDAYVHPDYDRLSRRELLIESQRKGVMGRKRSLGDVRRTAATVGPIVAEAVRQPEVAADLAALASEAGETADVVRERLQRLQEADLLLESGGDPNAVSPAGAVGVAQWLADTARRAGLRVDAEEYARIVKQGRELRAAIEAARKRPAEWRQAAAPGGSELPRDEWIAVKREALRELERRRLAADERRDPRKAIFAQTRYLVRLWRRFGGLDWALQAYHGGERGARRTLELYTGSPSPTRALPFEEVYFGISPQRRTPAFTYVYGRSDDHRYYWWRVLAAERALALYREDPDGFEANWRALAPGFPIDRAWYPDALHAPFADVAALQAAHRSGVLVPIPDDAARYGFAARGLAPFDAANERWYRALRPEALGILTRLAGTYREEGGRAPLRVTGAATTVAHASREAAGEGASEGTDQSSPPLTLHAAGWCVDVARPEARWDRMVLEHALGQLGDRMRIAWLRDLSADAHHLCPNPAFAAENRAAAR